jgi:hypothetical protein
MGQSLTAFIQGKQNAGASCSVKAFVQTFRAGLTPADRAKWSRTRVIAEMASAGYGVGLDRDDRATFIGVGLPVCIVDGRLAVA